jgi:hypothetical protein
VTVPVGSGLEEPPVKVELSVTETPTLIVEDESRVEIVGVLD